MNSDAIHAFSMPGALLEEIADGVSALKKQLDGELADFKKYRQTWRSRLVEDGKIAPAELAAMPFDRIFAIDGAMLADSDRMNTYTISCCVRVGQESNECGQSTCFCLLPHMSDVQVVSTGLMTMQEVMMAVESVEKFPGAICLIDGSRIASIINIGNFYSTYRNRGIDRYLSKWRLDPDSEPGRTIARFESRNWFERYLLDPFIIGSPKYVVSTNLTSVYAKEMEGVLDDKAFASVVLNTGEIIEENLKETGRGFFQNSLFPYADDMNRLSEMIVYDMSVVGTPEEFKTSLKPGIVIREAKGKKRAG